MVEGDRLINIWEGIQVIICVVGFSFSDLHRGTSRTYSCIKNDCTRLINFEAPLYKVFQQSWEYCCVHAAPSKGDIEEIPYLPVHVTINVKMLAWVEILGKDRTNDTKMGQMDIPVDFCGGIFCGMACKYYPSRHYECDAHHKLICLSWLKSKSLFH